MTISVDAEYLEELEEKAKRHDFFKGYIKGIEVAFAFAEELVKNIGNRKTESNSEKPNNFDKDINVRSKDEPHCYTCKYERRGCADEPCVDCRGRSKYEPKDEPQIGEMMTEEEFDSMLARVLTGKTEPQTERSE